MRTIHRAAVPVLLAVLLMAMLGAVSASSPARAAGRVGYVGTVSGTRAFVAVVVRGSSVIAYVCDSRKIAQWFKGTARSGRSTLTSTGGYVLHVTIGHGRATGSVRFPGSAGAVHRFAAATAEKPAGLYRGVKTVAGTRYLGGWIILPNGRQRGEVTSGSTDVASPTLNTDMPTVPVSTRVKQKTVVIVIIAILIG
jgi:hypothetical protein